MGLGVGSLAAFARGSGGRLGGFGGRLRAFASGSRSSAGLSLQKLCVTLVGVV